eukprot:TRINITY_DN27852_c0_g1_i1.p1 TRINITY_DN27852_c0_g1~~TRINITY_DN27852_c0_g1_i1.p1  ORF type:complete len:324 (+),score=82.92 TRINITY_DN27852_c0_g1_i1:74-1045(+)
MASEPATKKARVDDMGGNAGRAASTEIIGFAGLGAMGYHMAGHMSRLPGHRCLVWNRSGDKAQKHAKEFGTEAVTKPTDLAQAKVLVVCLPTSAEDEMLAEQVAPLLARGSCFVSCTSGSPAVSKRLANSYQERFGIHFLDCPVSGGPKGAAAGTLTCMLGADDEEAAKKALPAIESFAKKIVRCGPTGSGHAVKAVNNAMNAAHLLLGAEGLLALQRMGVAPEVALEAINGSSGRSLQTMERLPQEVLTGRFSYGFKLPLMAKDCRIAGGVVKDNFPEASLLPSAIALVQKAASEMPEDADYTSVVKLLEKAANSELRRKDE